MAEESRTPDLEEVTRRNFAALNRRDYDAILATFAPDAVWETPGLEAQKGHEAIRRLLEEWVGVYEDLEAVLIEFRGLGNGVTFSVEHQRGRLPGSTGWVEADTALATTWSDGLVQRVESSQDIDVARAAAEVLANERAQVPDESSTPNLRERLRLGEDAFNRRDFEGVVAFCKADAVWDASPVGLGIYDGRDAIRGFFEDWLGSYEDFEQVSTEFRALGNGITLELKSQRGWPRGSSQFVEIQLALVTTWTDELVERIMTYTDIGEARAAAERLAQERG